MYLKPGQLAKGERIVRIVDFIEKIDERTISEVGLTKLMVSCGPKKRKLDSVSLAQGVIGNTRIFFTLMQLGKPASPMDVQHYLAYTVKIMELSLLGPLCSSTMTSFVIYRRYTIIPGATTLQISILSC